MKQRIITGSFIAAVYIAAIFGTIYLTDIIFNVLTLFLMIAAGWEMCNCIAQKMTPPLKPVVVASAVVCFAAFRTAICFYEVATALNAFLIALLFMMLLTFVFCLFSKKYTLSTAVSTIFVMIYPMAILVCLLALCYLPDGMWSGAIIMAFLSTSLADSMAYFVGSLLKGPKLCPTVSPKKTVSGAIGGLVGGIISGIALFFVAQNGFFKVAQFDCSVGAALVNWIFIGLGAALFCEIGDLISSYVKRVCGIKDFGNLLAGHGGIMDRIDGLIVSSIYIYIYYSILILVL